MSSRSKEAGTIAAALSEAFRDAGARCAFRERIDNLPDDELAAVEAAIDRIVAHRQAHGARTSTGPSAATLADILTTNGVKTTKIAVNNHIAGRCICRAPEES